MRTIVVLATLSLIATALLSVPSASASWKDCNTDPVPDPTNHLVIEAVCGVVGAALVVTFDELGCIQHTQNVCAA